MQSFSETGALRSWLAGGARYLGSLSLVLLCAACSVGAEGPKGDVGREAFISEFRRIDASGRGKITLEEARAYYARRFLEIDRNRDNFLTPDELAPELPFINAQRPADLLGRLDRNGDGRLSLIEFQIAANWLFQLARTDVLTLQDVMENMPATGQPASRQRDFGGPRMKGM
jgi:hypothetical protein